MYFFNLRRAKLMGLVLCSPSRFQLYCSGLSGWYHCLLSIGIQYCSWTFSWKICLPWEYDRCYNSGNMCFQFSLIYTYFSTLRKILFQRKHKGSIQGRERGLQDPTTPYATFKTFGNLYNLISTYWVSSERLEVD